MSELAEVLELLHTADDRWRTIRMADREWRNNELTRRAFMARIPRRPSATVSSVGGGPIPAETEGRWKLWAEGRDRLRVEFEGGGETVLAVMEGSSWWSSSPSQGLRSNAGAQNSSHGTGPGGELLGVAFSLPALVLSVEGREELAGRACFLVLATPLRTGDPDRDLEALAAATPPGDEYLYWVDAERGTVLKSEARFLGQAIRVIEALEVGFDEEFPHLFRPDELPRMKTEAEESDLFVPDDWQDMPASVEINELPAHVAFTVFVPAQAPDGPISIDLRAARPRHGIPPSAHITCGHWPDGDADEDFFAQEAAAPMHPREWIEWRREGGFETGEDAKVRPTLKMVRFERSGTYVEVSAYRMSVERLLDIARSMAPLPPDPPRLVPAGPSFD